MAPPSPVWEYFNKEKCSSKFMRPATSTLYYHLAKSHFIHLKKLPPKAKSTKKTTSEASKDKDPDDPGSDLECVDNSKDGAAEASNAGNSTSQPRSSSFEGPMDRCISNTASFSRGGHRDEAATDTLLFMLMKDNMPAATVEREGFKQFVRAVQPLYHPPSEPTITKKLEAKYHDLRQKFGDRLSKATSLCLTTDLMTDKKTMTSNLGAALGLGVSKPPSEETPEEVLDVPDDEEAAIDFLDDPNEPFDENLATTEIRLLILKVKKVVRFFRSSDVATEKLKKLQLESGRKTPLKLIQEVRTRLSSVYYMLDRFLELADPVSRVLLKLQMERGSTRSKPPNMGNGEELEVLGEVRDLLRPLEQATLIVSQEKAVALSSVIPMVAALRAQTSSFMATSHLAWKLKEKILAEIEKRFSGVELLRPYAAATMLDPRFKQWAFESARASANIISHLSRRVAEKVEANSKAFEEQCRQRQQESTENQATGTATGFWATVDEQIRQKSAGAPDQERAAAMPSQLKAYLASMPLDRASTPCPMGVWESMKSSYPELYEVAMEFLPLVASSVSAERLFSHLGLISTQ
ncbi:Zinc finger BED domain-containing protein 4 [Frankliniella fusca]|uniref:Zinc finger BED domain-containing protein 4 n=1 Tax=Frankliniella fusca TaxID=407009 RepID=A0AAE1LVS9_9NEOP|nr:Zinc finger BED domain-containing protein 4 [Frankliniella fusca]